MNYIMKMYTYLLSIGPKKIKAFSKKLKFYLICSNFEIQKKGKATNILNWKHGIIILMPIVYIIFVVLYILLKKSENVHHHIV